MDQPFLGLFLLFNGSVIFFLILAQLNSVISIILFQASSSDMHSFLIIRQDQSSLSARYKTKDANRV